MLPPSPVKPMTSASGRASFDTDRAGDADAERAAAGEEVVSRGARRQVLDQPRGRGQRLVEDDEVIPRPGGQRGGEPLDERAVFGDLRRASGRSGSARSSRCPAARRPAGRRARPASASGRPPAPRPPGSSCAISYSSRSTCTIFAPGAERVVQFREDLGEDVGPHDQHRVGVADDPLLCPPNMCPSCPRYSGCVVSMLSSESLTPHTGASSSSATRVSSACAPETDDAVAEQHDRAPRRGEQRGRPVELRRHRQHRAGRHAGAHRGFGGELVEHVHRQCDEHRPARRGHGDLHRPPQDAQHRAGVQHPGRVLGHRPGHADQVGGHLRVHRVVADARPRRRSPPAASARAGPGTACRCRCRGRRPVCSWTSAGRPVARAYPSAMPTRDRLLQAPARTRCPARSPSASRKPCSTVPGLPNIWVMPSAANCSNIATRPARAVIVLSFAFLRGHQP